MRSTTDEDRRMRKIQNRIQEWPVLCEEKLGECVVLENKDLFKQ